jgi:hypothetical protein
MWLSHVRTVSGLKLKSGLKKEGEEEQVESGIR